MTKDERCRRFVNKSIQIYSDKYDYSLVYDSFVDNDTKVPIICPKHGIFYQTPHNHKRGSGCIKCSYENDRRKKRHSTEWFVKASKEIHGNTRYDYSKCNYNGYHVPLTLICHKKDKYGDEHGEFTTTPSNHLDKKNHCGCPKCNGGTRKSQDVFIKEVNKIYHNYYDTSETVYINNNSTVKLICPEHGGFSRNAQDILLGYGCPLCGGSILEREVMRTLKDLNLNYVYQYRPSFLRTSKHGQLSIDFYLPDINTAIECQGIQHFRNVEIFGKETDFNETLRRDKEKLVRCLDNNINILYITDKRTYNEITRKNINISDIYSDNLYNNISQMFENIKLKYLYKNNIIK